VDREARGHTGTLDCRCHAPQYHSHAQYNHCTYARHRRPRNRRRQRQGELHPRQARAGPCPGPRLCQLQGEGRHVAKRLRRKVRGARQLGWSTKSEGRYEPNGSLQRFFRVGRGKRMMQEEEAVCSQCGACCCVQRKVHHAERFRSFVTRYVVSRRHRSEKGPVTGIIEREINEARKQRRV